MNQEQHKKYYQDNKERIDARNKKWREANPEKYAESQRVWRENNEGYTYADPRGYIRYVGYKHPASTPSGITGYHRIVLWDKLDGQDAVCHWCDKQLYWGKTYPQDNDALCVDHLNLDKSDNSPENLVPTCAVCNVTRPGGQNRKPSKLLGIICAADDCDRPATTHYRDDAEPYCPTHYNQRRAGIEVTPIKHYAFAAVDDEHRRCRTCDEVKPNGEFYRHSRGRGYQSECKACMIKRVQERQRRLKGEAA